MADPTIELSAVTVHAAPSAQLLTGKDADAIFRGRHVEVLEARHLATDGQGYDTFQDAKVRLAPRESCCSLKGVCKAVCSKLPHAICLVVGGALGYLYGNKTI